MSKASEEATIKDVPTLLGVIGDTFRNLEDNAAAVSALHRFPDGGRPLQLALAVKGITSGESRVVSLALEAMNPAQRNKLINVLADHYDQRVLENARALVVLATDLVAKLQPAKEAKNGDAAGPAVTPGGSPA